MKNFLRLLALLLFAMPLVGSLPSCKNAIVDEIETVTPDGQASARGISYTSLSATSGSCVWDAFGSSGNYDVQLYNRTDNVLEQQIATPNAFYTFTGMSVRDCFDITVTRNGQLLQYLGAYNP